MRTGVEGLTGTDVSVGRRLEGDAGRMVAIFGGLALKLSMKSWWAASHCSNSCTYSLIWSSSSMVGGGTEFWTVGAGGTEFWTVGAIDSDGIRCDG